MTKILLVEDDKNLREIYGTRLYAEGYDIVSAGDGEEALAMAIRERPNLIISDVMMPKISGFDMLDILRTSTDTKDIPVIMMTALSSEDQRARGESLGATRYLVKSQVGIEDVVRTVHEVLRDAPGMAPANAGQASTPAPQNPNVSNQATPPPTPQAPTRNDTPYQPAVSQQRPSPQVNTQPRTVPQATAAPQQAQAPTAPSVPAPEAGPLPKPIAPFSTQRPASLGDRVLHPITPASNNQQDDLAAKMAAALSGEPELNIATPPQPAGDAQQSQTPPMPAPVNPMNQQLGSSPADNTQAAPTANQELPPTPQVPNQQQPPQQPTV